MPNRHETQQLEFVLHLKNIYKITDSDFLKERLKVLIAREVENLSEEEYELWKPKYSVVTKSNKYYKEYIVAKYQICINNKNEYIYKKFGEVKNSESFSPEDSWKLAGLKYFEKEISIGSLHNKKITFYKHEGR